MSLLSWIHYCNAFDPSNFIPFEVEGQTVGCIRKTNLVPLKAFAHVFQILEDRVVLQPHLSSLKERNQAVQQVLPALEAQHLISHQYHEFYPVSFSFNDPPLLLLERAAVPFFGTRASGVHLNAIVYKEQQCFMWIARRSQTRTSFPGYLDNLVAGGRAYPHSAWETLIKEAQEEAGIPQMVAQQARAVGAINYAREVKSGVRRDVIFSYDLVLPESFQPQNVDHEVETFYLWPIEKVIELVTHTEEFKTNCNLVIIDFLIRHGWITPETPHYLEMIAGLHHPDPLSSSSQLYPKSTVSS
ncbi:DUF4743 domain-containing protein [Deltaproteobacteria bacterium TL4]